MRNNSRTRPTSTVDDEVDQLLRAAQDELLLNLSVNTHTVSNSDLDPDLSRRFLALKSRQPSVPQRPQSSTTAALRAQAPADEESKEVLGDDLSARFAALKGPSRSDPASDCSIARQVAGADPVPVVEEEEDEEDEVEKILRWAKDAARLDPSPPSDEEDEEDDDDDDHDDSYSDSDPDVEKVKRKSK